MSRLREKTMATLLIAVFVISVMVFIVPVMANDVASSTMHFYGPLSDAGGGVYTGTIPMTAGEYYVVGGPGESIWDQGGFDIYAKEGGVAYVLNYYGSGEWNWNNELDTYVIGSDHDAYTRWYNGQEPPWGPWYDPDCADWDCYSLELTANHWYLRYTATGESPMSGEMTWLGDFTGYAKETDKGTYDPEDDGIGPYEVYEAGGPEMWDWNAGAQVERIPLEYPGFNVVLVYDKDGNYFVELTPAPIPAQVGMTAEVQQKFVSITVDPLTVDFGTLIEGETASRLVTVTNVGNVNALVTASLIDEVPEGFYTANLDMDGDSVASWSIPNLAKDFPTDVELTLSIPSPAVAGPKTATLVFWAEIAS